MNLSEILGGIETLRPFYEKPDGFHVGAEHDVVYLYATDKPLTPEAVAKMVEFGWFQEGAEYDPRDGFKAENYDPSESWTAYV